MIRVERHEEQRVAVLTMDNGPENRFHPDFLDAFLEVLDELDADDDVTALVVTGNDPKFWSNGLDLDWLKENGAYLDKIVGYIGKVNALYHRVTLYPKPVIAALNGHTFAGGVFLSAHMDYRLMRGDRGWVCMPESDINIPLLSGMIQICQAVMTAQGFKHMYYSAARLTAQEAKDIGFVDAIHSQEELIPAAIELASQLGKKKKTTYAEMKRRIRSDIAETLLEVDPKEFLATLTFSMMP